MDQESLGIEIVVIIKDEEEDDDDGIVRFEEGMYK